MKIYNLRLNASIISYNLITYRHRIFYIEYIATTHLCAKIIIITKRIIEIKNPNSKMWKIKY